MAQSDSGDDLPCSASFGNNDEDYLASGTEEDSEEEDIRGQTSGLSFEEILKARSGSAQKSVSKRANKNRSAHNLGQAAELSFEEILKARSDGSYSYRPGSAQKSVPKRANKNRPVEMSSKMPVSRFREVIQVPKRVVRDPRFDSLCGSYDESKFKNSYRFLYDEQLPAERKRLQALLKKEKSDATIAELKKHISWIDGQLREEQLRRERSQKLQQEKQKEKEAVKRGKKPFYVKKSAMRKQELQAKYKELKESGKLEAFLAKRRRKNAAQDHRYMPYRRPHAG